MSGAVVYLSHGGGPLPLLGDPGHTQMVEFMRGLPSRLDRPRAILVVSAHWEEPLPTLLTATRPGMLYDYYGFPASAYQVRYPAPGAPALAEAAVRLLAEGGIRARADAERGFDHGLFVPLLLMYPEADIPAFQVSLVRGLDPYAHLALGAALRPLVDEGVLVVGSGFSFHNLRAFSFGGHHEPDAANDAFQDWLIETCAGAGDARERDRRLTDWETAPGARHCHPREEHLVPLHVCVGAAGTARAEVVFDDLILGRRSVAFLWPPRPSTD